MEYKEFFVKQVPVPVFVFERVPFQPTMSDLWAALATNNELGLRMLYALDKALSHQPSALSPQPSYFSPQPSSFSPQPSALRLQPSAISPLTSAISPQTSKLVIPK